MDHLRLRGRLSLWKVDSVKRSRSRWEAALELQLRAVGLRPEVEFRFHESRRFRFDFAFPSERVAVEVEGGVWTRGRHTRGGGFESDCQKYSIAAVEGWCVIRATPSMVESGEAVRLIETALRTRRSAA